MSAPSPVEDPGLRALYQEVILDHCRRPRNRRTLEAASHRAEGFNPLCGDRIALALRLDGDTIADIAFEGSGCAISTATASLLTERLRGRTVTEARRLFAEFQALVTAPLGMHPSECAELDKLNALGGVREFPVRVKCATLAWHTLLAALEGSPDPVSTERECGPRA